MTKKVVYVCDLTQEEANGETEFEEKFYVEDINNPRSHYNEQIASAIKINGKDISVVINLASVEIEHISKDGRKLILESVLSENIIKNQ